MLLLPKFPLLLAWPTGRNVRPRSDCDRTRGILSNERTTSRAIRVSLADLFYPQNNHEEHDLQPKTNVGIESMRYIRTNNKC